MQIPRYLQNDKGSKGIFMNNLTDCHSDPVRKGEESNPIKPFFVFSPDTTLNFYSFDEY